MLAFNSQVVLQQILSERAACLAIKEEYFTLQLYEIMDWKGGTSLIFVPLGKLLDWEPYHLANFCLMTPALLAAPSICSVKVLVASSGPFL
jgi:hypothetical protein